MSRVLATGFENDVIILAQTMNIHNADLNYRKYNVTENEFFDDSLPQHRFTSSSLHDVKNPIVQSCLGPFQHINFVGDLAVKVKNSHDIHTTRTPPSCLSGIVVSMLAFCAVVQLELLH